jgi:hypothetical protein
MLTYFTQQTKILPTGHFCTTQTTPTQATAVALYLSTDHHIKWRIYEMLVHMMMVYNTRDCWVFGPSPSSGILKNTTFRKLDLFLSSGDGWETPTQLGSLERTNLNHWSRCLPYPHLRTGMHPASETLCSLEYQMMDGVQKPSVL